MLEFIMKVNAIYSSDSAFVRAGVSMQKLQAQTQALQNTSAKITSFNP